MRDTRKKRRQKRSYKRLIILVMILLVFVSAAACRYIDQEYDRSHGLQPGMLPAKNKMNVMIMGVDRRSDDVGRSDTLMVATIDTEKDKASLLSIPRDTRLKIKDNGFDKINAAYAYGGWKLTRTSVEELLGTEMKYYVLVDIKAFERIIDVIGGIDLDVDKRMYYEDPWDDDGGLVIDLYPGQQHLDGKRAIQYVRYRDGEGDIGRIGRQQKFMKAVLAKLISPSILPKLPDVLREVNAALETDMPVSEMLSLAKNLRSIQANGIETNMVPGKPAYVQDISYWLPDIEDLRRNLAQQLGVTFDEKMQAAATAMAEELSEAVPKGTQVLNDESKKSDRSETKNAATPAKKRSHITVLIINSSGINGAGARVADIMRGQGFAISSVETGKSSSVQRTTITAAAGEIDKFYGMPFPCTIMDGGASGQATVIIGKDYNK